MTIYLFRHAESIDNRCHVFSGWRNVDLSDKGLIDCQELAELLKDKEFSTIFTPNLIRNVKTVKEVLKYHPDAEIVYDDRIKERCYGDLQGTPHLKLMKEDMPSYLNYHRSYDVPPPDGESIADVEKRVLPFCDELVARVKKNCQNVAVCAGNNAMRVIRRKFENLTITQMLKIENPYDNYFEYTI
jgi:2,3-bisphosphoglycerate-dependent phosphoglycerate mutase